MKSDREVFRSGAASEELAAYSRAVRAGSAIAVAGTAALGPDGKALHPGDLKAQTLEAFTRAFRKAFGVSPSLYRRMGATYSHLYTSNGIHHHSGKDDTKGVGQFMDLFDIFSGQESWHTRRLLDLAKTLNDEQLDRPLKNQVKVFPWDGPDQSLCQILDRMVQTKEAWAAALTGGSMPTMDNSQL